MLTPRSALRDYFFSLTVHGIKLGLDNIQHLLEAAGNPERRYPAVHVAGTNGKGSVLAFLQAMLRAAGYRTGRFTSPHLMDLAERFQINATPIPGKILDQHIAFFKPVAEAMAPPPTFFEMCTAVAFRYFEQSQVDVALLEVGMGGRLDSTNVVTPLACAITNIALEHTQYLGDTIEKIAAEKAGILKPGVPAVVGEDRPGPRDVILARAREVGSPILLRGRDFTHHVRGDPWRQHFSYAGPGLHIESAPLALAGPHQGDNAAVATALAEVLKDVFPKLGEAAIIEGLATARWPCRQERVLDDPPVIVDAAHNVAGAETLAATFDDCVTVLAVASDKDAAAMIRLLAPISSKLILTTFTGERALPLTNLFEAAGDHPCETAATLQEAIEAGLAHAAGARPLLITGSIYTAGEARRILEERYGAPPLLF